MLRLSGGWGGTKQSSCPAWRLRCNAQSPACFIFPFLQLSGGPCFCEPQLASVNTHPQLRSSDLQGHGPALRFDGLS